MSHPRTVTTHCGVCEHSCGMQVKAEGNNILEIRGLKEHPYSKGFLCPKGLAAGHIFSAPDRLKSPLLRDGAFWKEISWDTALDLCAERLKTLKDSYGPDSLFVYFGQTYLKSRIAYFLMSRFLNRYGAVNISSAGSLCFISTMLAHMTTFGNMPFPDYENSHCILLWGTNPCACGGIGKSYPQMIQLLNDRKKQGARIITIDPRRTESAAMSDIHIRPRPGTDGAFALGMIRVLIDENLFNAAYVDAHTSGFEQLREMITAYPLDRIEQITGVPQNIIQKAARLFAEPGPACIKVGSGLEHHTNGVQSIRATNLLLALTGNIDVPGGNTFLSPTNLSSPVVNHLSKENLLGAIDHPMFTSMINQAQAAAAIDLMAHAVPYPVKGMIVAGGSPMAVFPNAGKLEQVMREMEFIVVIDQFMTETAHLSHLVLPAAMFLERDELSVNPLNLQRKVFEPDGPLPDWAIWQKLAHKMGYAEHFPWRTHEDIVRHLLETTEHTLEELHNNPQGILDHEDVGKFLREGFYTYSGKIEIYSMAMETNGYSPLPDYAEPDESPVSTPDIARSYPLILTTGGRYPVFVHSQHRTIAGLRKHAPEPLMQMHPQTAAAFGMQDGDRTVVDSLRGSIAIKVFLDEGIIPGVVHIPHGWHEANCNRLTDDMARDRISGFPAFKSSLCRVRKA